MDSIVKNFRPNLIPNNPKSESTDFDKIIKKNGGYDKYLVLPKKDGCRLVLINGEVLTRALKPPGSKLVIERFQELADECKKLNIILEGEFYMHGQKFNSIFRFFSKSDVTSEKYRKELWNLYSKSPAKFEKEYDGLSFEFLTKFHYELQFYIFDGIILDRPDLVGYEERILEVQKRILTLNSSNIFKFTNPPMFTQVSDKRDLDKYFETVINEGFEGLVLVHKEHEYKFGRNSLNQGTLLKMKDDAFEYDGIIINVLEGTVIKEGIERTKDKLGFSETSKKKDDREPSGIAKGFLVEFEGKGTFIVGLNGFDNEAKEELLRNKEQYIGRHFVYTAMQPILDFPRHAFFKCWRDEK